MNTHLTRTAPAPVVALAEDGHAFTTSLVVADHFGKRHRDVLRAIENLGCSPEFAERNFALSTYTVTGGKDSRREEPMYTITRDGFALLAMGFTGQEAMRWKEAYIHAFNAMEDRLRKLYVAPLPADKEFTRGIRMKDKLVLQSQGQQVARALASAPSAVERHQLYWTLHQINTALGIPMPTMAALGVQPLALPGGAA